MIQIQKIEHFFDNNQQVGIFLLRIFIGCRLLYGVIDNIISWEQMVEFANFLELNHFPFPIISAVTSVYVQFFGAIFILIGFKCRWAAFILSLNFIIALIFVHLRANDTIEGMMPALAMLFGCLTLLFTGADKISVKNYLRKR